MRNFNTKHIIKVAIFNLLIINIYCTKEIHVQYQVNSAYIYESKAQKFKSKNEAEYISILYTCLYQKAIDPMELFQAQSVLYSIGDQNVAKEMLLSGYFNNPKIIFARVVLPLPLFPKIARNSPWISDEALQNASSSIKLAAGFLTRTSRSNVAID